MGAELDPVQAGEGLGMVLAGLVGFVGYWKTRGKRRRKREHGAQDDLDELWERYDEVREQLDAAMTLVYAMRDTLRANGITPPPLPPEVRVARGRHAASSSHGGRDRKSEDDDE